MTGNRTGLPGPRTLTLTAILSGLTAAWALLYAIAKGACE